MVAVAQPADDAYRRGIEAMDGESWTAVAEAMEEAVSSRPTAGGSRVKIYGMRFEDYTPYFYWALALDELGRCRDALDLWSRAESAGILKKNQLQELRSRRDRCPSPPAVETAAVETAAVETPPTQPAPRIEPTPVPANASPMPDPWAAQPPAETLRRAAADYLAHRYGQALEQLATFEPEDPLAESTTRILRAACRFALYRLGGEQDEGLLQSAKLDLSAAQPTDVRLSAFWFSPDFRRLYEDLQVGAQDQNR